MKPKRAKWQESAVRAFNGMMDHINDHQEDWSHTARLMVTRDLEGLQEHKFARQWLEDDGRNEALAEMMAELRVSGEEMNNEGAASSAPLPAGPVDKGGIDLDPSLIDWGESRDPEPRDGVNAVEVPEEDILGFLPIIGPVIPVADPTRLGD